LWCISTRPISINVLRSSGLTGDNFVRSPLMSRNTQRRWIVLSTLKPASGESGWSVIVSFLPSPVVSTTLASMTVRSITGCTTEMAGGGSTPANWGVVAELLRHHFVQLPQSVRRHSPFAFGRSTRTSRNSSGPLVSRRLRWVRSSGGASGSIISSIAFVASS
jgi:hypothetical protein